MSLDMALTITSLLVVIGCITIPIQFGHGLQDRRR